MTVMELYSRIFEGGAYGDSWYPYTHLLIEIVIEMIPGLSLILIVFYAGELVWKPKSHKFDGIINATPTKNWVFFMSKLITLSLLPILLIAMTLIICVTFQLVNGYHDIDVPQYLSVFYFHGLPLVVFCMVAIFIQTVARYKYLGMGLTALVFILLGTPLSRYIGIEHPMLRLIYMPIPAYSDMSGYTISAIAFGMYAIYWMSFGGILSIYSFKKWPRLVSQNSALSALFKFENWNRWEIAVTLVSILAFVISGRIIYSHTNIEQTYMNTDNRMDHAELYEQNFKKYDEIPRLHYLDIKTKVEIYPSQNQYAVSAEYTLTNKNDVDVKHLFLYLRK